MSEYALTELDRRVANMIRIGKIKEVDIDNKVVTVDLGTEDGPEHVTDWLPWGARRAGSDRTWDPPDVGEQVVVIAPGGELDQAFVGHALFSDDFPANGSDAKDRRITFKDGSVIEFDRDASKLNVTLNDNAVFTLKIGSMEIKVTKDGAEIGKGGPTKFATRDDRNQTEIKALRDYVAGHTHPAPAITVTDTGGASATAATISAPASPPAAVGSTACDDVKIS